MFVSWPVALPFRPAMSTRGGFLAATTSPVRQHVYIEDTDTFGIIYYANYVRFYERAAVQLLGLDNCARALREGNLIVGVDAVRGMKFRGAAVLGDAVQLSSILLRSTVPITAPFATV